jgi:hypothetical protein
MGGAPTQGKETILNPTQKEIEQYVKEYKEELSHLYNKVKNMFPR